SILSFAVATGAVAWIVSALTASRVAAVVAAVVFAANPNVLYLQSTPMTEPLLLALTLLGVALLIEGAALKGCASSPKSSVTVARPFQGRDRGPERPALRMTVPDTLA